MNKIKPMLASVKAVRENAALTLSKYENYLKHFKITNKDQSETAVRALQAFMRIVSDAEANLAKQDEEWTKRFASVTVLQAVIVWRDKRERIPISKPNDRVQEPHVSYEYFENLIRRWNIPLNERITTNEDFDIAIVDKFKRKVNYIRRTLV